MNRRKFFKSLAVLFGSAILPSLPSIALVNKGRPLIASWSIEPMQDLTISHGVDLESELTTLLAKQIQEEIDRDILNDLAKLTNIPQYREAA